MPAQWRIEYWPCCVADAFLSHCAEDREGLVFPVFQELRNRGIVPWIDRHDYPVGRDAVEALREELLKCRHVVYFLTPAMLRQGRGWASAERILAGTIQQMLRYGDAEIAHVELPLMFVASDDPVFRRSIWRALVDRAGQCPHAVASEHARILPARFDDGMRQWQDAHVQWAANMIESFIRQEERWAVELAMRFDQDHRLRQQFAHDENLMRRVLVQAPRPFPGIPPG